MRKRLAFLWLLTILATTVFADPVTFDLSQGGAKIGQNTYERKADGSFTSVTNISVSGVTIDSKLSGKFVDNKLTEFTLIQEARGTKVSMSFKSGKLMVSVNGKDQPEATISLQPSLYSNYHPGIASSILANLDTSVQGTRPIKVSVVDNGGVPIDATVTPKSPRKIKVEGKEVTLRPFVLNLSGIDIEFVADPQGEIKGENVAIQKALFIPKGYEDAFEDPVAKYKELSQPTHEVKTLTAQKVKMRDGIELVCDIAMPAEDGKYPAILVRTPYGRAGQMLGANWWAKRGYVYMVQDCRGRQDSGGAWDPFVPERKDGKDTIDWMAKQPWSNGKVGMIGASYGGYVQWAAAVERPAALKCIIPQVSPPDAMRNIPYENGVFTLLPNLWWTNIVRNKQTHLERATQPLPNGDKLKTLPLSKLDDVIFGENVPFWDNWLKREGMAKWAKGYDTISDMPKVTIPALHISGWWDGDGIGTKTNWATMRAAGRTNQWLIYGPWPHAFNTSTQFGDVDYGPKSVLELDSVYLRWFDTWLKGKPVGFDKIPHVQAFLTGANKWLNLSDWPLKSSPVKRLYFQDAKSLTEKPVKNGKQARYTYDPAAVQIPPQLKGNLMAQSTTKAPIGKSNGKQLVYRSAPLKSDMALGGPISVELYFSTNVVSTDFYALLLDEDEKGDTRIVCLPGKLDVRYLQGLDKPRLITPGKTYKATINLWDTAHLFKKGHRVTVAITSDMFPGTARNLNTGEPLFSATKMKVAKQVIYQDAKRPSCLTFRLLPVK